MTMLYGTYYVSGGVHGRHAVLEGEVPATPGELVGITGSTPGSARARTGD